MKTLKLDDEQEEVRCPKCSHTWFTHTVLPMQKKIIHCPDCRVPLRAPTIDINKVKGTSELWIKNH